MTNDLIIIGGGVMGAFHAYHAIERGQQVVLLERDAMPQGATVRNFGQIVPSGMDPRWQLFGRESLRIYRKLQSQIDLSIRNHGTIYIASDEDELTLIEELHAINQKNNYESELWTTQKCRNHSPQLRADYCRGGLFFRQELSVNPRLMIHRLHDYLGKQSNYQSHFQTGVRELFTTDDDRVMAIATDGRTFKAKKAILCCGSEFQTLFPEMFRNSDLEAVKLQMLRLKPQPNVQIPGNVLTGLSIRRYESFSDCPSWSAVKSREPENSFAKQWGVHILFKQESDGGIILGDSHEYASAAGVGELGFDHRQEINDYFIDQGRQIFDLPSWEIETSWCGVYCQTSDPSGVYTQTIDRHIHVVTGIGGKGMTSSAGFALHHLVQIDSNHAADH